MFVDDDVNNTCFGTKGILQKVFNKYILYGNCNSRHSISGQQMDRVGPFKGLK